QYDEKVAQLKRLEKENTSIRGDIGHLEAKLQELHAQLAIHAATQFKQTQYDVSYTGENDHFIEIKTIRDKVGGHAASRTLRQLQADGHLSNLMALSRDKLNSYATKEAMENLHMLETLAHIHELSHETKS